MDLKEKVKALPCWPGVYLFKDVHGQVIYVGKASNLKKRVASYFKNVLPSPRLMVLVSHIVDIEYILTSSEEEALIYEAGLIKQHMPRYNVALKDDKSYPFLKLSIHEPFPQLMIIRTPKNDGAKYFGPYTNAKLLRRAVGIMRKLFPLRTCRTFPKKVCLLYSLGQCKGPCEKRIDQKAYQEMVTDLILFLEGKKDLLVQSLSRKMHDYSNRRQFEEAALMRDHIAALTRVQGVFVVHDSTIPLLRQVQRVFLLKRIPLRIEAFDISTISGDWAVGSMVCFEKGIPKPSEYRRFRIKTIQGVDDYAMLKEVLERRYTGTLSDTLNFPDLILIDGGRGHLNAAREELLRHKIDIALVSIAKKEEHIFLEHKRKPLILPHDSAVLQCMQRIRDEAHRFAKSYHTLLRKKSYLIPPTI